MPRLEDSWPDHRLTLARQAGEAEQRRLDKIAATHQTEAIQARIATLTKEATDMSNSIIQTIRERTAARIEKGDKPEVAEERVARAFWYSNPHAKVTRSDLEALPQAVQSVYRLTFGSNPAAAADMFLEGGPETESAKRERLFGPNSQWTAEESKEWVAKYSRTPEAIAKEKATLVRDADVIALMNATHVDYATADSRVSGLETYLTSLVKPKSEVQVLKDQLHGMSRESMGLAPLPEVE